MASTIHPVPLPTAPPTFSRNSTSTTMNGMQLSQSHMNSFDGSQSVASTPAATPPPRAPLQQSMSFNMGNNGINHTPMMRPNYGAGPPPGPNGYGGYPHQPPPNFKPSIYTAIYSGVSVYEMEVNQVAVMRRRSDAWLNATQILKVAGVEKGKRTKVLEKEILTGEHEKVQGGYGKYQGTWINYRRGVEFCRQYGVEELLRPLLEYDMGPDGSNMAGKGGIETPTKEQAMAAQRKRLYGTGVENRPPTQSSNGSTFFKNISSAAVNAVNAMSKARYESPGPRQMDGNRRPNSARRPSQQMGSQDSYPPGSQQSAISMVSQNNFTSDSLTYINPLDRGTNGDMQEPPRKRMRPSSSQERYGLDGTYDVSMHEATPTEPNESFAYQQHGFYPNGDEAMTGLDPLPHPHGKSGEAKIQLLTSLFIDSNQTDFSDHPALLTLSGDDLEIPLDPAANTAVHWAATLARPHLLRALIGRGASMFRVNSGGETALLRACVARNNLDKGTFPEILDLLGPTIEIRDGHGRTILHHIAISSSIKGRGGAGRYYLDSLLEFVIKQGSAPSSQQNSFGPGMSSSQSYLPKSISLARFMSEIVNAQDKVGDTALNLAARISNKGIIQQLLEVNADPCIANRSGLKPVDFGVGLDGGQDPESSSQQLVSQESSGLEKVSMVNNVKESSQQMMSNLSSTLADAEEQFAKEIRLKQESIDAVHAKLREASTSLVEEKRRLEGLQADAAERTGLDKKITNLRQSASNYHVRIIHPNGKVDSTPRVMQNVRVGEADAGLEINPVELDQNTMNGAVMTVNQMPLFHHLDPTQLASVAALPSPQILRARISAYKRDINSLESDAKKLRSKSSDLEGRYRKIISLCADIDENKVDESLDNLLQAVVSEGKEEGSAKDERTRMFLELLRGVEE